MMLHEELLKWIMTNIDTGGFRRCDDRHLDELSPEYRQREIWLDGVKKVATELCTLRQKIPMQFCIAIGMSLISKEVRLGVTYHTAAELDDELTLTPPSVYVFERGKEPWNLQPGDAEIVDQDLLSINIGGIWYIHFEYRETYEETYRRSSWVVCS